MSEQPEKDYTFTPDFTMGVSGGSDWEIGILHLPEDETPIIRYAARSMEDPSLIFTTEFAEGQWQETTLDGTGADDVPDKIKETIQARNLAQLEKRNGLDELPTIPNKQAIAGSELELSEETLNFLRTPDSELSDDAIRAKAEMIEDFVAEFKVDLEDLEPAAIDLAIEHFAKQAHQANSRGMHSVRDTNEALDRMRVYQQAADSWLQEQEAAETQAAKDAVGTEFEEGFAERELRRREDGRGKDNGPSV